MGIDPYPAAEFPTNAFQHRYQSWIQGRGRATPGSYRRTDGSPQWVKLASWAAGLKGKNPGLYRPRRDCPDENKDLYNTVFKKPSISVTSIGVKGFVFRTQTGEISVHAKELCLLSKSQPPLSWSMGWRGLRQVRWSRIALPPALRWPLIVNDGVKETFPQRATVLRTLRKVPTTQVIQR